MMKQLTGRTDNDRAEGQLTGRTDDGSRSVIADKQ